MFSIAGNGGGLSVSENGRPDPANPIEIDVKVRPGSAGEGGAVPGARDSGTKPGPNSAKPAEIANPDQGGPSAQRLRLGRAPENSGLFYQAPIRKTAWVFAH